jgi:hypothetical protein
LKTYIQINWKNLKEMEKFLVTYNHQKLNQEENNHLNSPITCNEIDSAIKSFCSSVLNPTPLYFLGFLAHWLQNEDSKYHLGKGHMGEECGLLLFFHVITLKLSRDRWAESHCFHQVFCTHIFLWVW